MNKFQELIEEYDNLMQAGLHEVATEDFDLAEEYFSDAAHILRKINDETLRKQLELKYTINPFDFEQ